MVPAFPKVFSFFLSSFLTINFCLQLLLPHLNVFLRGAEDVDDVY